MTSYEAMQVALYQREEEKVVSEGDFEAGWYAALDWSKSGQEPVAWIDAARFEELKAHNLMTTLTKHKAFEDDVALFSHPAPAQPVRLSEGELFAIFDRTSCGDDAQRNILNFANAIQDAMLAKGAAQPAVVQQSDMAELVGALKAVCFATDIATYSMALHDARSVLAKHKGEL